MKLSLPIKPAQIPSRQWDIFLEKYYIPYLQANHLRILREGVSQKDVDYFSTILDKLADKYYSGLSGLGWGAIVAGLVGNVISAIPQVVSGIAQYKLGKTQIKLQKEEIEARKKREAAEAELSRRQQEAMIQQTQVKSVSTINRAIEAVTEYSPYLLGIGGLFIGAIILYKLFLAKRR